eukprot:tig00000157_g9663.t1
MEPAFALVLPAPRPAAGFAVTTAASAVSKRPVARTVSQPANAFLGQRRLRPAASFAATAVRRPVFFAPALPARAAEATTSPSLKPSDEALKHKRALIELIESAESVGEMRKDAFKQKAEALAQELAKNTPCEDPATSVFLRGTWQLIFTTETPLDAIMENGLPPFYSSGCILQEVQGENRGEITNIIELVKASKKDIGPVSPESDEVDARFIVFVDYEVKSAKRLRFQFKRTLVKAAGSGFHISIPLALGSGSLDTMYLDEDFRVQTDSRGWLSVFKKLR